MSFHQEIRPFASLQSWAEESARLSWSRREFLRGALGAAAISAALKPRRMLGQMPRGGRKAILVTFGGGARDEETFSLDGQRNIPQMVTSLAPQGTFFPQVINRGILGHYVATASITTGRYETFDNFVAQGPANPTLFEYFRRELRRPAQDAWVIAPSNGFEGLGASSHAGYGADFGAEVILPKRLLASASASTGKHTLGDYEGLLRDNYESPYKASDASADTAAETARMERTAGILRLSMEQFAAHAKTLSSPDELSVYIAKQVMREAAPSLILITLHDIDIAHSGAFSLYLEGIQRADRLCAELWSEAETNPEYKGRTTMFILPDFGRDADGDPGGNGFQHHRTGSAMARTTWMLALGQGARAGNIVQRPIQSVDVVPTIGQLLGFSTPLTAGQPLPELA